MNEEEEAAYRDGYAHRMDCLEGANPHDFYDPKRWTWFDGYREACMWIGLSEFHPQLLKLTMDYHHQKFYAVFSQTHP